MKHGLITLFALLAVILLCAEDASGHTRTIHENLASDAMSCAEYKWGSWLPTTYKQEIADGSWEEDLDWPHRSKHHGYNPITQTTGGIFTGVTAKERAIYLWQQMVDAFNSGNLTGGDEIGAYHFLGRCCHMLQDMTTYVHIHPQDVQSWEHGSIWDAAWRGFEDLEEEAFAHTSFSPGQPLMPTNSLPNEALTKLDDWSKNRLQSLKSGRITNDSIGTFIEMVALITYFRATFWGEVVFVDDTIGDSSGEAAPANTTATSFGDGSYAPSNPNILHRMFGAGNVRYRNSIGDDWFEIIDANGNDHTWKSTGDDEWFPCAGDKVDGSRCSGSDPTDEGVRTTGRFHFTQPFGIEYASGALYSPAVKPLYYPDGTSFVSSSLGYYISVYSMLCGVSYNAGLLNLANRRLTVQSSPSSSEITLYREDNLGNQSGTTPFDRFFVSGEQVTLTAAPFDSAGNGFVKWLKGGVEDSYRTTTVTVNADIVCQAIYEGGEGEWTLQIQSPEGSGSTEPTTGSHTYLVGATAQVTGTPQSGWHFAYWTGTAVPSGHETDNPIEIPSGTDGQTKTLKAVFELNSSGFRGQYWWYKVSYADYFNGIGIWQMHTNGNKYTIEATYVSDDTLKLDYWKNDASHGSVTLANVDSETQLHSVYNGELVLLPMVSIYSPYTEKYYIDFEFGIQYSTGEIYTAAMAYGGSSSPIDVPSGFKATYNMNYSYATNLDDAWLRVYLPAINGPTEVGNKIYAFCYDDRNAYGGTYSNYGGCKSISPDLSLPRTIAYKVIPDIELSPGLYYMFLLTEIQHESMSDYHDWVGWLHFLTMEVRSGEWTLDVQAPEGSGSTVPDTGSHDYSVGNSAQVQATPSANWHFSYWRGTAVPAGHGQDNPITIPSPDSSLTKTLQAVFERDTWILDIQTPEGSGTTDPTTGQHIYNAGDDTQVSATPATDWEFAHWEGDAVDASHEQDNPITILSGVSAEVKTLKAVFQSVLPDTFYVNDDSMAEPGSICTAVGDDVNDGLSPATPMRHIQSLLNKYPNIGTGRTVWVDHGTYAENITIGNSHSGLTLQGSGAEVTVIDGGAGGSCILMDGFSEGVVSGFTLQNGTGTYIFPGEIGGGVCCLNGTGAIIQHNNISMNSAKMGGGIGCLGSSPTILENTITLNFASSGMVFGGGGVYCKDCTGTITRNTISQNTSDVNNHGGGILCDYSDLLIEANRIESNVAGYHGGGIVCRGAGSSPTISANVVIGNSASSEGGGISTFGSCSPVIANNLLCGNDAVWGGGLAIENLAALVVNNTINGNSAQIGGGIHCGSSATAENCIVWGNLASIAGDEIAVRYETSVLTIRYSDVRQDEGCVYAWEGGLFNWGDGIFAEDPLFTAPGYWEGDDWIGGDYHLQPGSPCIDSTDGYVAPDADLDGNLRLDDPGMPNVGIGPPWADMGAYEFQGTTIWWTLTTTVTPPEGGTTTPGAGAHSYVDGTIVNLSATANTGYSFDHWEGDVANPNAAETTVTMNADKTVTAVFMPDVLYVNDDMLGEAGSVCTVVGHDANDGFSPDTPMRHIQALLDKYPDIGEGKTVWVDPGTYVENIKINAAHSGLTLQGAGQDVATIDGNQAGSCLAPQELTDGVISGFTFCNGNALYGGGMYNYYSSLTITNCTFSSNNSTDGGGGMLNWNSAVTVTNCVFSGNSAVNYGGGMYNLLHASPTITNCIFTGNSAGIGGGGMINDSFCSPMVSNCTFNGNSADEGGGMYNFYCTPVVTNCILWGNMATLGPQIGFFVAENYEDYPSTLTVCCSNVQGGEADVYKSPADTLIWEPGNIDADPLFVSPGHWDDNGTAGDTSDDFWVDGDYHLSAASPCIDSSDGSAAPDADIEGNPRYDDQGVDNTGIGTPPWVDMGAYERQTDSPVPEIKLRVAPNGGSFDLSAYGLGSSTEFNDLIENLGDAELILSGDPVVQILGSHAADVSVISQPGESVIMPDSDTSYRVRVLYRVPGNCEAIVSVPNNDSDENPYEYAIHWYVLAPEIEVEGNGQSIVNGDVTPTTADGTDFGSTMVSGGTVAHIFTVLNEGDAALNMTGAPKVECEGTHAADFAVTVQPNSPVVPLGSTTFEVTFDPSEGGLRTAEISIANNDTDENPYRFSIQGMGIVQKHTLTVQSIPIQGVPITGTSADITDYSVQVDDNTTVTLTAPMVLAVGDNDYDFVRWTVNGMDQTDSETSLTFNINEDTTCVAVYAAVPRALTVQSTPIAGVSITGSPADITNYSAQCDDNSEVSLIAPATHSVGDEDYNFVRWAKDGVNQPDGQAELSFNINADTTCVAVYAIDQHTLTIQSTPIQGVAITGTPSGTTDYSMPVDDNTAVNLTAPMTISVGNADYVLVRWIKDGEDQPEGQNEISFNVNADTTCVAVYQQVWSAISGSKWNDLNGNGEWDQDEPGLEGWKIYVDQNGNNSFDEGEPFSLTDVNGAYMIADLAAGTYVIGEEPRYGWEQTYPASSVVLGRTKRVSVDSAGTQGVGYSGCPAISADGRYVAFYSAVSTLVPGDTNDNWDVFVHDRQTGATECVSVEQHGNTLYDLGSWCPSISADGRYVAFHSESSTLLGYDENNEPDIFVYDRKAGVMELASVYSYGVQGNSYSIYPAISGDGRYVAFLSYADNLVLGDTNDATDVFIRDRETWTTERVSVDSSGIQANGDSWRAAISANGRYVAFGSHATNLLTDDTNGFRSDIFVHDRETGITECVTVNSSGVQADIDSWHPAISADGRYVAFESDATNLVPEDANDARDIFVHDRHTGATERVSIDSSGIESDGESYCPTLSADGRYVAFLSNATNLVPGDTNDEIDVFLHDRETGVTECVGVDSSGVLGEGGTSDYWRPALSADGRHVAFGSQAANLVAGDTNGSEDVLVRDRVASTSTHTIELDPGETAEDINFGNNRVLCTLTVQSNPITEISVAGDPWETSGRTDYSIDITKDTLVSLTVPATTASDMFFSQWEDNLGNLLTTDLTLQLTMDEDKTVVAVYVPSVEITGHKWNDLNGNGEWDQDEPGLEGWKIYIDQNGNNSFDEGEPFSLTDTNGQYAITGLAPGIHTIAEQMQPGWEQTYPSPPAISEMTELVSVDSSGTQGNYPSYDPVIGANGRYVVFASDADNLVTGDDNGACDVFIRDRETEITERMSVNSSGIEGDDISGLPDIDYGGRHVAFISFATDLVPGDTNDVPDVFVYDRQTGVTERVSVDSSGIQGNNSSLIYSPSGLYGPDISADGRYVTFASLANNLVAYDGNNMPDIFVHDRESGATERVSINSSSIQADHQSFCPAMSDNGRYVAFVSEATNLMVGDSNDAWDIFAHDRLMGTTERVSLNSSGTEGNGYSGHPAISADGRYVAFTSDATNLVIGDTNDVSDIFVHDQVTGTTERISVSSDGVEGNGHSRLPSISTYGRYVAFTSDATDLVIGDTNGLPDVFVRDRQTGTTERVSVDSANKQGDGASSFYWSPDISADGRYVAFGSQATDLVTGDTNDAEDVFVHDRFGPTSPHSVDLAPGQVAENINFGNTQTMCTLTVNSVPIAGADITGTPAGTTEYSIDLTHGTLVTLTAPQTLSSGNISRQFIRWQLEGVPQEDGQTTLEFTITAATSATAEYEEAWGLHMLPVVGNGTTNPTSSSDHTYSCSDSTSITATPAAGWKLDHWEVDGSPAGNTNPITVGPGTDGQVVEVKAVFVEETWTLRVLAPTGSGITSPTTGDHTYNVNTSVDVIATPAAGWQLAEWHVDGSPSGTANPLTLGPGTDGQMIEVQAIFVQQRKGDFDFDGDVDFWDFMAFIDVYDMTSDDPTWLPNGPIGDFDDDGNVDFWDFMELIDVYGT